MVIERDDAGLARPGLAGPDPAGPDLGGSVDGAEPRRRRHWVILVLGIGLVAVLAVTGTAYGRYLFRSRPGPKSMSSAIKGFRATPTTAGLSGDGSVPASGVYELHGQGSEHISFPPNSQADGNVMPASVTDLGGGCWRWHVDYNVAHWEEYDFCRKGGQQLQVANRNFQSWDFGMIRVANTAQLSCQPPLVILDNPPAVGQTVQQQCTGTNSAVPGTTIATGPFRVVGIEPVSIGSTSVSAVHVLEQTTISGPQRGTAIEDWWFAARTGLPLRVERQIALTTPSPLGAITYTEGGSWQMVSVTPQT